jgi:Fe-S cluster assembly iron-binding protein IscA
MANDPRPNPPILKRFANLDFDGVETVREKPAKATPERQPSRGGGLVESAPTVSSRPQSTPPSNPRNARPEPPARRVEANAPANLQRPRPLPRDPRDPRDQVDQPRSQFTGDPDLDGLVRMSEELNENSRVSRQNVTPEARRAQRAAEIRSARPMDPYTPRSARPPTTAELRERQANQTRREVDRIRYDLRPVTAQDLDLDLPDGMAGGVVTVELDLSSRNRRGGQIDMRFDMRPMPQPGLQPSRSPGPMTAPTPARSAVPVAPPASAAPPSPTVSRSIGPRTAGMLDLTEDGPLWDLPRSAPTRPPARPGVSAAPPSPGAPIELTPMAARQIQLMAWEAGVPGSPLRILTSASPGLGHPEIDFAFDESVEPDDIVIDALGVTVVIDPQSLRWVRGRRITWHDVPGSEGFLLR